MDGGSSTEPVTLDAFEALALRRRAMRRFKPDPLPEGLLDRLIEIARWAPSGYNLQPTHFVAVTDPEIRRRLVPACMDQKQVADAPAVVVLTGDRNVVANHFEQVLKMDREKGATGAEYESLLRRVVPLAFKRGPLRLNWLWKATLLPLVRFFRPVPDLPAVHMEYWLAKQVMLSAMNLMLAAESAGLNTVPMEGFDDRRVRKVLGIPRSQIIPLIITIGYGAMPDLTKSRLPIGQIVHRNGW